MIELRLMFLAVGESRSAIADRHRDFAVKISDNDPVVARIGDEETPGGLAGQHLPRKAKLAANWWEGLLRQGSAVNRAICVEFGDHPLDEVTHRFEWKLPFMLAEDMPARIDEHQGWPGA